MKKLVFAVIAAVAMVSVSNVFASNKTANVASVAPVDTVAPADTTASETETPAQPAETPADSTVSSTVAE